MIQLSRFRVPQLAGLVKGTCDDFVSEWIVERNRVDDVFMSFQCQEFVAGLSVPNFARSIITSSDESTGRRLSGGIDTVRMMLRTCLLTY